jgi:DNA repair ATPase RecN
MPERAHVTSVEAIDAFRASLIIYLTKARPALEDIGDEVLRTRMWLQNDQIVHWENQVRRRLMALEQAQQALFSAELSKLRAATDAEQMAVQRARRALTEAEEKLRRVKQWHREYDSRVDPLAKQLDQMHNVLTNDIPKAIAHLANVIKVLNEYADLAPPSLESPGPLPADAKSDKPSGAPPADNATSGEVKP